MDGKNPYPGVNAHLNSFLQQQDGGWESFHAVHIIHIYEALDAALPDNYYVSAEKSLQIGSSGFEEDTSRRTRPDVAIYQQSPSTEYPLNTATPTATLPLLEIQDDEADTLTSVVIYEIQEGRFPGKPVTWLELLSPANKPPASGYLQYRSKRRQTLRSGVALVEIDYLHERRPVNPLIPSYADQDAGAYPYMILISTPVQEHVEFYGFHVDDPIPTLSVPLAGDERIDLDLNTIYHRTIESRVFRLLPDYQRDPVNIERYTQSDQQKIRRLLQKTHEPGEGRTHE